MMTHSIFVLNCGSSSLKFSLVDASNKDTPRLSGLAEKLGTDDALLTIKQPDGTNETIALGKGDHALALAALKPFLAHIHPTAIGHRVVHGGEQFSQSIRITPDVLAEINQQSNLAPLHNPANILGILAAQQLFPDIPHVAVFDTAFHSQLEPKAYRYAVPKSWYAEHQVRKYGFHGTSHAYVSGIADQLLGRQGNWISAHLGNGCSLAAISQGKSVDTTMGLTPLDGLVMGTRSGAIDPGIIFYMHDHANMPYQDILSQLNKKSGLLGVSDQSNDMRTLIELHEQQHVDATLAIEVFCYQLAKHIMAMSVALPSLDGIIFTGGIGENASLIRALTITQLSLLNITLNNDANMMRSKTARRIDNQQGRWVLVVPTDEEWQIAKETLLTLS